MSSSVVESPAFDHTSRVGKRLTDELYRAWEASGLTLRELRQRAGLDFSKDSLSRKLNGLQPLSLCDAARIAAALSRRLVLCKTERAPWRRAASRRAASRRGASRRPR